MDEEENVDIGEYQHSLPHTPSGILLVPIGQEWVTCLQLNYPLSRGMRMIRLASVVHRPLVTPTIPTFWFSGPALDNPLPLSVDGVCDFLLTNRIWQRYVTSLLYGKGDGTFIITSYHIIRLSLEILLAGLMK